MTHWYSFMLQEGHKKISEKEIFKTVRRHGCSHLSSQSKTFGYQCDKLGLQPSQLELAERQRRHLTFSRNPKALVLGRNG